MRQAPNRMVSIRHASQSQKPNLLARVWLSSGSYCTLYTLYQLHSFTTFGNLWTHYWRQMHYYKHTFLIQCKTRCTMARKLLETFFLPCLAIFCFNTLVVPLYCQKRKLNDSWNSSQHLVVQLPLLVGKVEGEWAHLIRLPKITQPWKVTNCKSGIKTLIWLVLCR